jgi:hypothetical protein
MRWRATGEDWVCLTITARPAGKCPECAPVLRWWRIGTLGLPHCPRPGSRTVCQAPRAGGLDPSFGRPDMRGGRPRPGQTSSAGSTRASITRVDTYRFSPASSPACRRAFVPATRQERELHSVQQSPDGTRQDLIFGKRRRWPHEKPRTPTCRPPFRRARPSPSDATPDPEAPGRASRI